MRFDWRSSDNLFPFAVWGISRILILLWALAVTLFLPVRQLHLVGDPPRAPATDLNLLIEPWARWDTLWYMRIATTGYSAGDLTVGFFPLYPLLIRTLTYIIPNALLNALLISNLATLAALIIFYRVAREFGEITARRAVIYWIVFPTSFYLFAGYAEALFVLAALIGIEAARKNQWTRAGIGSALAALTRPPGFLILVPLAVEWFQARGSLVERARRAIPLVLVPLVIGLYMLYLYLTFGDPFFWLHAWNNVTVPPWDLPIKTLQAISAGVALGNNLVDFSFTFFILGLTVIGVRSMPWSFTTYALMLILVQMMAYPPTLGFAEIPMEAMARRVIVVFPAFLVLAQVWRGRFKEPVWVALSIFLQLIFMSIFVRWLWLD